MIVTSFAGLCVLLLAGHFLRRHIKILRVLYLPSSVIGGLIGLAVLESFRRFGAPLPASMTAGWGKLPGFLINIVFACLFLGVSIPKVRTIWKLAGAQLAYGQIVAWGQYVVGVGLCIFLLSRVFGVNDMFGGIVPVGFEGGHGTAGGMGPTFEANGWSAGKDLALASATVGILGAVIFGMALVNWATRRGYTARRREPESVPEDDIVAVIAPEDLPSAGRLTVKAADVEAFSLHLAIVGLAMLIGFDMKEGILFIAGGVGSSTFRQIAAGFPLFPLCMIGGIILQLLVGRFYGKHLIDHGLTRRIQNSALDFLVIAAIATIRIDVVAAAIVPFAIIVTAAIAWNILCVVGLARFVLPDAWFERSIAEMGQSMGVTATGLLLLRVVDPEYETPAAEAFAAKQLLHEPFMGGGLWTGAAIPLLAAEGPWPVFLIACGAVVVWSCIIFIPRLVRRAS